MKVLLLADANSPHTIRWAISLAERDLAIEIFSLSDSKFSDTFIEHKNINVHSFGVSPVNQFKTEASPSKTKYLFSLSDIKRIIKEFKPDILHAHYASSYGLLGALSGFHPYILSVWGTDVVRFPGTSFIHKGILKYNLSKADKILATSYYLAGETEKYTSKKVEITPFGINTGKFFPDKKVFHDSDCVVIGTIKSLEKTYGIEYLIKAFGEVKNRLPGKKLKLMLVGRGALEREYKKLVGEMGLEDHTIFTGYIPPREVSKYHNMLDIFVALSNEESFGVAVLEASACAKPVIVTNIGGLTEVVENNRSGFIVERRNIEQAADAIEKLVLDENLRNRMGENGRLIVKEKFNWENNVEQMISIYNNLLKRK